MRAYTGTFRIPPQARPMLRALLLDRASRLDPPPALFVGRDGAALLGRRIAHRVRAAADLAALRPGMADLAREKCYTPETFATVWNDSRMTVRRARSGFCCLTRASPPAPSCAADGRVNWPGTPTALG